MVKGTDDDDFKRLQRLGFNFDGPRDEDEFRSQPASGSVIGGIRGAMEYGIREDVTLLESDEPLSMDDIETGDLEYDPEPFAYGDPTQQLVATSEWSNSAAYQPEEIIERAEPLLNPDAEGAVTRSNDVDVPRSYVRNRRSGQNEGTKGEKRDEGESRQGQKGETERFQELQAGALALAGCAFCGAALALSFHYLTDSFRSRVTRSRPFRGFFSS